VAQSLANLAGVLAEAEDWGGARRLSERGVAILEKAGGLGNPQGAILLQNLGLLDLREGMAQSGHDRCRAAVEVYEKEGGPKAPALPEPLACLGWAQLELGQSAQALVTLERAMAIRGEGQSDYGGLVRLLLARALSQTGGDAARATTLRGEARAHYRKIDVDPPERIAAWLREPG
jgi:hypothetical protein